MSEIGISIGQVAVDKKSNEIKAIPDLLKILDIRGCYLTIDAMGTQETIAQGIVKAGGHYVLKVKKNQRILMEDIKAFFDENATSDVTDFFDTEMEKNHGREEYREYVDLGAEHYNQFNKEKKIRSHLKQLEKLGWLPPAEKAA
jgi:predicted transposase YbfD/YdcC